MSTASSKQRKTYRTEWVDRWSPPKPLFGLQAIEKLLNRHTFLVTPESRLVVAVIARAIHDCLSTTNRRQRREARRFLLGDRLTRWCDLVGLHPDFVRCIARKAGYLADEKAHWQKVPIKVPVPSVPTDPVVGACSAPVHSITCHAHNHPPQGGLIHA
ncbi:hypothetical protein IEG05_14100 [Pseudomonas kunmingensis]|uniref:hypothetical protein n=1 Tax=Stutzerimonas kunmingensis TaxID=1211807 RepID=UPI0017470082|nr:hypothetical protein [Stutzerimonas kunmingensis]MBD3876351.1 hypothetical protein [Stutzerimonas kunmingensis]